MRRICNLKWRGQDIELIIRFIVDFNSNNYTFGEKFCSFFFFYWKALTLNISAWVQKPICRRIFTRDQIGSITNEWTYNWLLFSGEREVNCDVPILHGFFHKWFYSNYMISKGQKVTLPEIGLVQPFTILYLYLALEITAVHIDNKYKPFKIIVCITRIAHVNKWNNICVQIIHVIKMYLLYCQASTILKLSDGGGGRLQFFSTAVSLFHYLALHVCNFVSGYVHTATVNGSVHIWKAIHWCCISEDVVQISFLDFSFIIFNNYSCLQLYLCTNRTCMKVQERISAKTCSCRPRFPLDEHKSLS